MKRSTLATLAGLLGYSIFGFSFLFSKLALELTTPFVLLSVRFLTAFLVMNLLVLTGKMKLSLGGKPVRMLLLLGLVQPVVYFICENYGIALTSTSFSGIMLGIIPIAGLVLGRLILKALLRLSGGLRPAVHRGRGHDQRGRRGPLFAAGHGAAGLRRGFRRPVQRHQPGDGRLFHGL